jgi:hypothetical protein
MRMSNYTHDYNRFLARLLRWLDIAPDLLATGCGFFRLREFA